MTERDRTPDTVPAALDEAAANDHPAAGQDASPVSGDDPVVTVRMRVRRAPNFSAFIATGAVLGMIVGFLFDQFWPAIAGIEGASPYAPATEASFFAAVVGLFGGLIGALVAIWLDKRS